MLRILGCALSMLVSLLLLAHMILTGGMMLGILQFLPWFPWVTKVLMIGFVLHTLLSCYFLIKKQPCAKTSPYGSRKSIVYTQRITAIALVVLMPAHILAFSQHRLTSMIGFLLQLLLVAVSGIHMGISIPKALAELGVVTGDKPYHKGSIVSIVVSAAASIYSIVGFCVLAGNSGII